MMFPPGTGRLTTGFIFAQLGLHILKHAKKAGNRKTKEYLIGVAILMTVPVVIPLLGGITNKVIPIGYQDSLTPPNHLSSQKTRLIGFALGIIAYHAGIKIHRCIDLKERKSLP